MSKIDYQKIREIAEKTKIAGEAPVMPFDQRINALNDFMKHFSPDIALALLDERERNLQYIKSRDQENEDIALKVGKLRVELEETKSKLNEQREYYEGVIADGSKRSGSQAQKLVEAIIVAIENEQERLFDEDYLMDSKECIDVIREEVKRWDDSRNAGIRIKGE
ncbi:EaA protein [Salmonella phage SE1 (in:P22virus)]|uniref:EaA protein n=1 Tax=Salmonella phage SE1 (in:P22virus) TaxID=329864 RepID=A0A5C0CAN2_9CAUD|nr:EaA protein [Salmonella phage SE10]QEI23134.1 EaA protein [Salmonella phage SE1 (in:P22virus)]